MPEASGTHDLKDIRGLVLCCERKSKVFSASSGAAYFFRLLCLRIRFNSSGRRSAEIS